MPIVGPSACPRTNTAEVTGAKKLFAPEQRDDVEEHIENRIVNSLDCDNNFSSELPDSFYDLLPLSRQV